MGFTIPYTNANVYNLEHFFKIVECAGNMVHGGQFQNIKFETIVINSKITNEYRLKNN